MLLSCFNLNVLYATKKKSTIPAAFATLLVRVLSLSKVFVLWRMMSKKLLVWVSQTFSPRAAALWISWPTKSFIKPAESGHGPMRGRVFVLLPKKHYRHRNKFQWHLGRVKRGGFDQVALATNLVGRKLHKTGRTLSRINERESLCLASSKGIIVIVIQ